MADELFIKNESITMNKVFVQYANKKTLTISNQKEYIMIIKLCNFRLFKMIFNLLCRKYFWKVVVKKKQLYVTWKISYQLIRRYECI